MAIGDTYLQEKKYPEAERVFRALFNSLAQPTGMDRDLGSRARLRIADDVIVNDGDVAALSDRIDELHQQYLLLATRSA